MAKTNTLEKRVEKMINKYRKCIVSGDWHIDRHDEEALELFFDFVKDFKPNTIVLNGDICDVTAVSKFRKDVADVGTLQTQLDVTYEYLTKLRKAAPEAKIDYIPSNHDYNRLENYLKDNKELHGLRSLKIQNLLKLNDNNINFISQKTNYKLGEYILVHGDIESGCKLSQYPAYSARLNVDKLGDSLIQSHSHRLGMYVVKKGDRLYTGIECGHLSDESKQDYVSKPNWAQGFTVVYVSPCRKKSYALPVVMKDWGFIFNNKLYERKK